MSEGRSALAVLGTTLGFLFLFAQIIFWGGTSLGVVHEYCLDEQASRATNSVQVESSWTYILWPPFFFANVDPAGRCVRNSPLREGLNAVGIWHLPSPEEQVSDHIEDQLGSRRR
ncbi:MAG TPA: hypothetical protein VIE64_07150 [Solirubrobacterales bacterium]|jgi:hypothetical protein